MSPPDTAAPEPARSAAARAHWRDNRRAMVALLLVWAVVSFGLGIAFVEPLNAFRLGGFPLGFWFSQQGAIYVFVFLILVYALWMDRIDRRYGLGDEAPDDDPGGADDA